MDFVALRASLSNTMILLDLSGNPDKFNLLKLSGFEYRVVLQLSSSAGAVGKSKLPEGVDLILWERTPLVPLVTGLTTFLSLLSRILGFCVPFLFGLTMSEEGGFDELEEFFSALASFSSISFRRLSSSAIFAADSSHP